MVANDAEVASLQGKLLAAAELNGCMPEAPGPLAVGVPGMKDLLLAPEDPVLPGLAADPLAVLAVPHLRVERRDEEADPALDLLLVDATALVLEQETLAPDSICLLRFMLAEHIAHFFEFPAVDVSAPFQGSERRYHKRQLVLHDGRPQVPLGDGLLAPVPLEPVLEGPAHQADCPAFDYPAEPLANGARPLQVHMQGIEALR